MVVVGIVCAVFVLALVALYVWTRRSERDIEIPERVLTDEEKHARLVAGSAAANIIGGGSNGVM